MTSIQAISAIVLWALVLALSALVIMLYREVDLAYGKATRVSRPGLPIGSAFPGIDVVDATRGEVPLRLHDSRGPAVIAVVSSTCSACAETVARAFERGSTSCPLVVLVTGAGWRYEEFETDLRATIRWISNPGDVLARLKVSVVPSLFAVRDGIVVESTTDGSDSGLVAMIRSATDGEAGSVQNTIPALESR
jgi:hypothetical protein